MKGALRKFVLERHEYGKTIRIRDMGCVVPQRPLLDNPTFEDQLTPDSDLLSKIYSILVG